MSSKFGLEDVFGSDNVEKEERREAPKRRAPAINQGKKPQTKKEKTVKEAKKNQEDLPWQDPQLRASVRGQTQLRMHEPYHAKLKFLIEEFRPEKSQNDFIYKVVAEAVDKELQKRGYSKKDLEPLFSNL